MDSDWNLTEREWMLMSKCNKCAAQLFPHSVRMANEWADMAYRRAVMLGISPEQQRDNRSPNWRKALDARKIQKAFQTYG